MLYIQPPNMRLSNPWMLVELSFIKFLKFSASSTHHICCFTQVCDQRVNGNRCLGFEFHPKYFEVILGAS